MTRQEIEKLLGGYATGTLTPTEEQALFAAALEDQQLFDTLVQEQPLRDLLDDPAARASLLAALTEERVPWYRRFARPLTAAAALLCVAVPLVIWKSNRSKPQPVLTAEVAAPVKPPVAQPVMPLPAPAAERPREAVRRTPPARVRAKAAAEPTAAPPARQAEAKQEPAPPPAAEPAKTTSTAVAATGAVAPSVKDAMVGANQPAVAGAPQNVEITAQELKKIPASTSNGFLQSQTPANLRAAAEAGARLMAAKAALARLKWTVLRRRPDGEFAVADPANLQAGDAVKLRLEAQEAGYVHIVEGQKQLSSPINPGKPFETTIEHQGAGTREVEFWFTSGPVFSQISGGAQTPDAPHAPSTRVTLTYK